MGNPLLQKWQRDLNCLGDADRSTRQRALSRFDDALGTGRGAAADLLMPGARSRLVGEGLLAALSLRLSDPVEKNRELALRILWQLVEQDQCGGAAASSPGHALEPAVVASMLSEAARVGASRLCEVPFPESSEELRLRWLELLTQLVAHPACRGALGRELGALCRIVGKCSADGFPDCKRQCALLVSQLCARAPEQVHLQLEALLVPTLGSLAHQHAKVRQSALDAVKSLVLTCCESSSNFDELMRERVLPAVRKVNHDRASAVRIQGIQLVSDLLLKMPCSYQYRKDLLPIALFGLADPAAQIQDMTLATVESVGERLTAEQQAQPHAQEREREHEHEHEHELAALSLWDDLELPEPFKRRPGRGARELVVQTLPSALPALLKEATDWTAAERFRAVALLRCMLVFAEGSVAPLAPAILETLFAVFGDEEPTIAAAARDCSRILGRFLAPSQLLAIVLPACLGVGTRASAAEAVLLDAGAPGAATVAADTGSRRLGALAVLASAVRGLPGGGALPEQLGNVAEALAQPALGDSEAANVQAAVLRAAQAVLDRQLQALGAGGASLSVLAECRLLRTLLLLATSAADADGKAGLHAEAEVALALLAATAGCLDTAGAPDVPRFCELRCRLLLPVCVAAGGDADAALLRLASGDSTTSSSSNNKQQVLVDAAVCGEWSKARAERRLLDQLVRRVGLGGLERAGQLPMVVAVLLATAPAERDADLRLCMLALLDTIISSGLAPGVGGAALDRFLPQIVLQVLLPALVWRAGRVSSTIRKVSTFCLSRLVKLAADPGAVQQQQQQDQQQQQARTHWYAKELPRMLPTLKGCLDDQEADTRRFACDCLAGMCQLVARAGLELDAFAVTETYHDVVKRLDDADDGVRVAGCGALAALLAAAPPMAIKGTVASYVADACFIHLDDPAAQVQEAVFHVLKTLLDKPVDADMIKDKARTHRARHRNPHFCDLITSN
jgi:hypothetical protein